MKTVRTSNAARKALTTQGIAILAAFSLCLQPVAWAGPQPMPLRNGTYTPTVPVTAPQTAQRGRHNDSPVFNLDNATVLQTAPHTGTQDLNADPGQTLASYVRTAAGAEYFNIRERFDNEFRDIDLNTLRSLYITTVDSHQVVAGNRTTLWTAESDATFKTLPGRNPIDPQIRVKITRYKERNSAGRFTHYVGLQLLTVLTRTTERRVQNDPRVDALEAPPEGAVTHNSLRNAINSYVQNVIGDSGRIRSMTVVAPADTTRDRWEAKWEAKIKVVVLTGRTSSTTYYLNVRKPNLSSDRRWLTYKMRRYLLEQPAQATPRIDASTAQIAAPVPPPEARVSDPAAQEEINPAHLLQVPGGDIFHSNDTEAKRLVSLIKNLLRNKIKFFQRFGMPAGDLVSAHLNHFIYDSLDSHKKWKAECVVETLDSRNNTVYFTLKLRRDARVVNGVEKHYLKVTVETSYSYAQTISGTGTKPTINSSLKGATLKLVKDFVRVSLGKNVLKTKVKDVYDTSDGFFEQWIAEVEVTTTDRKKYIVQIRSPWIDIFARQSRRTDETSEYELNFWFWPPRQFPGGANR